MAVVRKRCEYKRWIREMPLADFEDRERGHEPENMGGLQKLE